jgi:hypothetical protein
MTQADLRKAMKYYLRVFRLGSGPITNDTVHKDVLSEDGYGRATPKNLYKGSVNFTLNTAGEDVPRWPAKWMELSVLDLSRNLLPGGE